MAELLQTNNLACGYVYKGDQCAQYVFHNTPKNIAYFLGSRPMATKMVVTDELLSFLGTKESMNGLDLLK